MRNVDNFGIIGKASNFGAVSQLWQLNVDNFDIVSKVSNVGAVGQLLW